VRSCRSDAGADRGLLVQNAAAHPPAHQQAAAALILIQTLGDGHRLVFDARAPALAVAAVLVWRRAPFLVVVLAAAAAALLRAVGW
jgi:hypothetical protein